MLSHKGETLTDQAALKFFKSLPASFDEVIIENNETLFRSKIRTYIPFMGLSASRKHQVVRDVIVNIIKTRMEREGVSVKKLQDLTNISHYTLFNFIEGDIVLSMSNLQQVLSTFGLSLDVTTEDDFINKYLVVRENVDVPIIIDEEEEPVVEPPVDNGGNEEPPVEGEEPTEEEPVVEPPVNNGGEDENPPVEGEDPAEELPPVVEPPVDEEENEIPNEPEQEPNGEEPVPSGEGNN